MEKRSGQKKKIFGGSLTVGSWITIANVQMVEIMAGSGFDWLVIDMEHSAIGIEQALGLIQVIELAGCVPMVRVGKNDPYLIKRVMDSGAYGVIVPMVNSKEDAEKAVSAVKYPPKGKRGVGLARAQEYGAYFEGYRKWVEKESIVIVQIEHIEAIENLEAILAVPGVDASMIGPYDLSASLGYPGNFDRKEMKDALSKYVKTCIKMKKHAGIHVIPPDARKLKDKMKQGFKFIVFSFDAMFLTDKIKTEMKKVRG